uniref:DHC_N2 domain-containing protein n=1 Tax=Caenorhabditis tropicalis TaxID=1561998 RepID=A0A1I7URN6_9PELO
MNSLTRTQKSEQLLLDFGFGWVTQKLDAHHLHCPDGTAQKSMIEYFKAELPRMREELCWITNAVEFEKRIQHFRNTIGAVDSLLEQSKTLIISHREAEKLTPVWLEELEWAA